MSEHKMEGKQRIRGRNRQRSALAPSRDLAELEKMMLGEGRPIDPMEISDALDTST